MAVVLHPRHAGRHPELKSKTIVPDVLLQPHKASLETTFYEGKMFPREDTVYEAICVPVKNGLATGAYEEFLTGFVAPEGRVWGRRVGVAVARDGSPIVTDDGSSSVWRVSYSK